MINMATTEEKLGAGTFLFSFMYISLKLVFNR